MKKNNLIKTITRDMQYMRILISQIIINAIFFYQKRRKKVNVPKYLFFPGKNYTACAYGFCSIYTFFFLK